MTMTASPAWHANAVARLPRELVLSAAYLYGQGAHMPLIHNAPAGDDRHKRPLWRGWQHPELRPTLPQTLDHLAKGGLIGLLPASIGMVVCDIDEYDKDGLSDWISRYPPLGDVPSLQSGRTHLYYNSAVPFHNRQQWRFRLYGISMEIRSRHGFVILWDPEAVAEIVAERSMATSARGMTRLPRGVLGLKVSRSPWPAVATAQGLPEPPPRGPRPRIPPRTPLKATGTAMAGDAPRPWILPAPPDHLCEIEEGRRNNEVFDAVRYAVYRLPRGQGGEAMRARWYSLVLTHTEACNGILPDPMRQARVVSTARSVARFTWQNPFFGRTDDMGRRDPAVQRERGLASGRARRSRLRERNRRIIDMHHAGWSIAQVARQESLSAVQTWRVVAEDRATPGIFHEPIAPPEGIRVGSRDWEGKSEAVTKSGMVSRAEEINRNSRQQPEKQPETAETQQISNGTRQSLFRPWEDVFREAAERRRHQEAEARERDRARWRWSRSPPEEEG